MQKAFTKVQTIFAMYAMIVSLHHDKSYTTFTHASDYEVEAIIIQ